MLVLTRRVNESIVINGDIVVTVLEVARNGQVRIGIDAPRHYQIYRRELWLEIQRENRDALASAANPDASDLGISPKGPVAGEGKRPNDEPTPTGKQPTQR